jgi:hypothetical protein
MTNDNKLDDLKTKATELGEDLKLKAQAAKLEGEKYWKMLSIRLLKPSLMLKSS